MKNKHKYIVLFLTCIIFLISSCATTLKVNVTRPAKLNLNGAKTIAVLPFTPSDKNPFNYFFSGDKDILSNYFNYYSQISSVEHDVIDNIKQSLESSLMKSPYITLVNSRDVKSALKYGGKNPADVLIGGEIVSFRVNDRELKEKRKVPDSDADGKKPEYYYEFSYTRDVELIINYEIVDGDTRRIIAHDTKRYNESSGNYKKVKDLPNIYYMLSDDLNSFVSELMRDIQPYTVSKSITLLEDKTDDPNMKNADELAQSGYYKESYSQFIKIYMHKKQFEAGYNAAMLLLAMGELESSEALMSEVYRNHGDKRALDALYDIRNEIKQAKILDNQINPISDEADYEVFTFDYDDFD